MAVVQFVAVELISLFKIFEVFTGAFDAWNIRHETVAVECTSSIAVFSSTRLSRDARVFALSAFSRRAALFKEPLVSPRFLKVPVRTRSFS